MSDSNINQTFAFINAKINEIEKKYSKPGWTIWGVLCACAGAIWLFISQMEQETFILSNVMLMAASLYLIIFPLINILRSSSDLESTTRNTLFVKNANVFGAGIKRIVLLEIIYNILIYLAFANSNLLDPLCFFAKTLVSIYILLFLITFIATFSRVPIALNHRKESKFSSVFLFLLFYVISIIVGCLILTDQFKIESMSIVDFKNGALLCIIAILIHFSIELTKKNLLLENLIQIKTDLALGYIDINEANEKIEIVIMGLRVEKYLDRELNNVMNTIHDLIVSYKNIEKYIDLYSEICDKGEEKSDANKDAIKDACRYQFDMIKKTFTKLRHYDVKLKLKLLVIKKQLVDKSYIIRIEEEVSKELNLLNNHLNLISNRTSFLFPENNEDLAF